MPLAATSDISLSVSTIICKNALGGSKMASMKFLTLTGIKSVNYDPPRFDKMRIAT